MYLLILLTTTTKKYALLLCCSFAMSLFFLALQIILSAGNLLKLILFIFSLLYHIQFQAIVLKNWKEWNVNVPVHGIDIYKEHKGGGWEVAIVLLVFLHIIRISQTSYGLPFRRYLYTFFTISQLVLCAMGKNDS